MVVTSYTDMVPGYAGSLGYEGAPQFDWGRPQVVTALSVRRQAASRLAYSPTFRVSCRSSCKDETGLDVLQCGSLFLMSLIS